MDTAYALFPFNVSCVPRVFAIHTVCTIQLAREGTESYRYSYIRYELYCMIFIQNIRYDTVEAPLRMNEEGVDTVTGLNWNTYLVDPVYGSSWNAILATNKHLPSACSPPTVTYVLLEDSSAAPEPKVMHDAWPTTSSIARDGSVSFQGCQSKQGSEIVCFLQYSSSRRKSIKSKPRQKRRQKIQYDLVIY